MRYHPHTEPDIARLLKAAGAESLEGLFSSIPKALQLHRPLQLPPPLDERALLDYFGGLAGKNRTSPAPFLGAGAYPHHVPVAVDQLLLRSEFYTAYTPYQPEVAQGTLQAIFEFQTFVCLLTGLEIANASLYDGATACAEALLLGLRLKKDRHAVVISGALHPSYRAVIRTYLKTTGTEVREVPYDAETGRTDAAALKKAIASDTAMVLLGSPNFFGVVEEVKAAADLAHDAGALLGVAISEALSLGILASPGELGADVAVGEMQSFGNGMNFGGPGLGFLATREAFLRQIPGRICGETVDNRGQRAFVLTLSTREQHIRRENATSNICTNNGLNALAATMHLAILGKRGLHELALLNWRRAKYARERMVHSARFSGPTFNEFVVRVKPGAYQRAHEAGMIPGLELGAFDPALRDCLLLCVTELHDKHQIDLLADALRDNGRSDGK